MTTLTVTATEDYRDGSPPVAGTTEIVFSTSVGSTARFNSSQFGGSGISNTVAVTGDGNADEVTVHTLSDTFFSAAGWTFSAWSAVDIVRFFGTNDAETMVGSSQSNTMEGGGGADFLTGGNQNDSFTYSTSSDAVAGEILNGLGGTDSITVVGSGGVDLSLVAFLSIERLVAGGPATLDSDQIGAGAINELMGKGSAATVTINGSSVDLTVLTFTTWDVSRHVILVNGTGGDDDLTGSSQNDTMVGGLGADSISGGEGDDTFVYNASTEFASGETINGGGGIGDALRINVGQGFSLDVSGAGVLTGVEKVVFAQAGELRFSGENVGAAAGLINAVTGSAGANRLRSFDSDVDLSGVTFTNWTTGEDTIFFGGTAGDDTLIGSSQVDQFSYQSGGVDALSGGGGDDFFSVNVDAFVAGASIDGGSGNADRISTAGADFSVGTIAGVERLTFFDLFIGTAVGITVSGAQVRAGGIVIVDGGDKDDTLTVKGASVNLTGVTFNDWTAGVDRIVINGGASAASALTGSSLADEINGGSKNDTLDGGAGIDALKGGLGNDTYVLGADTGDTITDTGGVDTVTTTISRSISGFGSVEKLTLLGTAVTGTGNGLANTLLGNGLANTLNGAGGADTLNGDAAADTMRGGADGDTYIVDNAGDVVDESVAGSSGTDVVLASVNYSLASKAFGSVENLTLTGAAVSATGNGIANTITGNASANTIDGKGGADTMRGLGANDTYIVDNANDVVDESAAGSGGTDAVEATVSYNLATKSHGAVENLKLSGSAATGTGNAVANVITGNDGANSLDGQGGNDRLIGGFGADQFTGGLGIDTFAFLTLADSGKKKSARDTILDFTAEDFIDLSAIDAKKGGTDNKFKFISKQNFHDKKGELRFQKKAGDVIVTGDVNGDGKADFSILLDNLKKLAKSDFEL